MDTEEQARLNEQRRKHRLYLQERRALIKSEGDAVTQFDKGVLTLSGGALLLSMTFVKDIAASPRHTGLLFAAWVLLALAASQMLSSLFFSQLAFRRQYLILDSCWNKKRPRRVANRYAFVTHCLNVGSIAAFLAGLILLSCFIWVNMPGKETSNEQSKPVQSRPVTAPG